MLPLVYVRSQRISDFLLKVQYTMMVIIYAFVSLLYFVVAYPFMYIKIVINSFYIALTNTREKYRGENLVQLLNSIFLGPLIIIVSLLVDFIMLPAILLQDEETFELKYQSDNKLTT